MLSTLVGQSDSHETEVAHFLTLMKSYQRAIDQVAIVATTDRAGVITGANDKFCETSGYRREELIGRRHNLLNSGYHPRSFFVEMWRTIGSGRLWRGEICNREKNGSLYWVDTTIVPQLDTRGRSVGYVSVRYDITPRKLAEAEIIEENSKRDRAERLLREIMDAVPSGIVAFDEDGGLVLHNAAFADFHPSLRDELIEGLRFDDLVNRALIYGLFAPDKRGGSGQQGWTQLRQQMRQGSGKRFMQELADGRWLQVQRRISGSGYTVSVQTDITSLKKAESRIKEQAERDPLTGLYNRRVLLDKLAAAMGNGRRPRQSGALILIDLDGFKVTNDTLGHDAGDELLRTIAQRLLNATRKTDVVARLGGDEFAVLAHGVTPGAEAEKVAHRLLGAIEAPLKLGTKPMAPSASLGIASYPGGGGTPAKLMQKADLALYEAKHRGRSTYVSFRPAMLSRMERQGALARDLREYVRRQGIDIALQPQMRLGDRQHSGFEALARWRRRGQMVPPQEFINVATTTGLMVELGALVARKTFAVMSDLGRRGLSAGTTAINVAADQLREADVVRRLCDLTDEGGMDRGQVELEVTEQVVLDRDGDRIVGALREMHQSGFRIALDDFGTGYASLTHLTRFPIDRIKIDKSFVHGIELDKQLHAIARSIVSLAHDLGMEVVAEGVETRQQLDMLEEFDCDYVQGYLVAKPLPPSHIADYLATPPIIPGGDDTCGSEGGTAQIEP